MTSLLYRTDPYLKSCQAKVTGVIDDAVILDKTIFFAEDGTQPADTGKLLWQGYVARIEKLEMKDEVVYHTLAGPVPQVGQYLRCILHWQRRYALMRTYTAQLLAVVVLHRQFKVRFIQLELDLNTARIHFHLKDTPHDFHHEIHHLVSQEIESYGRIPEAGRYSLPNKLNGLPVAHKNEIGNLRIVHQEDAGPSYHFLELILEPAVTS